MILKMFKHRTGGDVVALQLHERLKPNYPALRAIEIEHVLRGEGLSQSDLAKLQTLFSNPVIEATGFESALSDSRPGETGQIIEVSYQRAMTDPELDSIRHGAKCLGIENLVWARLATRYKLVGVDADTAAEIAKRYLYNSQVQTRLDGEWDTLVPQGDPGLVEYFNFQEISPSKLQKISEERRWFLSADQLTAIRQLFLFKENRPARDAELEMLAAYWSDHCNHTTWKALGLLQALQDYTKRINHPLVISAFNENSGVMRFYGGWAINIKGETHISPTFAGDPYGGIMTKHGGVIRDVIFTGQGAYPIAGTTVMATCDPRISWDKVPKGAFHPRTVLTESIRGTKDYNNPMGIPMSWSEYLIHPRNWKGIALGHSIGILPESRAKKGVPQPGDLVVLIGGPTGIDGIHGATVSSGAMTSETAVRDAAHVQIGMPIEQRKFMEAIPFLRDADCIRACTDCGAAGLASAVGELGAACGVWVNLAWIPLKCSGMRPWEIWLSESQERGVLVIPREKLETALQILESYGVPAACIGAFTASKRCQVVLDPELNFATWISTQDQELTTELSGMIVVDLPYNFLTAGCPLPKVVMAPRIKKPEQVKLPAPQTSNAWVALIQRVLGHFNICDQSAAGHQFDCSVQGTTVLPYLGGPEERMPDELSVRAPIFGKPYGKGHANAINQLYGEIDPAGLGQLMLASATAKLVAAGISPREIAYCANVCSPPVHDSPENAWALSRLVRHGYGPGSVELGSPVITGKDSSNCRFIDQITGTKTDAPLTLDILAVGIMPDVKQLIPKPFQKPGDLIGVFCPGLMKAELGGSILYDLHGYRGDKLPELNLAWLRDGLSDYHRSKKCVHSRSAIAEGGLIRRLFECCLGSGLGCVIDLPPTADPLTALFAELHGSIMFTANNESFYKYLGVRCRTYGTVIAKPDITVRHKGHTLFSCPVSELAKDWGKTFAEVL